MNRIEAAQKEIELATLLSTKYPDIQAHVDLIAGSDEIIISFFWDQINRDHWAKSKSFRCKSTDYNNILNNEIMLL